MPIIASVLDEEREMMCKDVLQIRDKKTSPDGSFKIINIGNKSLLNTSIISEDNKLPADSLIHVTIFTLINYHGGL